MASPYKKARGIIIWLSICPLSEICFPGITFISLSLDKFHRKLKKKKAVNVLTGQKNLKHLKKDFKIKILKTNNKQLNGY